MREGIGAILDAFPALDLPRSFSVTRSRWGADPLCRGSYSYVTPGASGNSIEALSAPLVRHSLKRTLACARMPHTGCLRTERGMRVALLLLCSACNGFSPVPRHLPFVAQRDHWAGRGKGKEF